MARKIKCCPHCNSIEGFEVTIELKGYQYEQYNFIGKVINIEREAVDDVENNVACLNCGKSIPIESVKYKK